MSRIEPAVTRPFEPIVATNIEATAPPVMNENQMRKYKRRKDIEYYSHFTRRHTEAERRHYDNLRYREREAKKRQKERRRRIAIIENPDLPRLENFFGLLNLNPILAPRTVVPEGQERPRDSIIEYFFGSRNRVEPVVTQPLTEQNVAAQPTIEIIPSSNAYPVSVRGSSETTIF